MSLRTEIAVSTKLREAEAAYQGEILGMKHRQSGLTCRDILESATLNWKSLDLNDGDVHWLVNCLDEGRKLGIMPLLENLYLNRSHITTHGIDRLNSCVYLGPKLSKILIGSNTTNMVED